MSEGGSVIAEHFAAAFRQAAGSLTAKDFALKGAEAPADTTAFSEPVIWQQSFSTPEGPSLWIYAGRELWETLARITLEAAGLDSISEQDARSTWQEILGQTIGGIAAAVTADILREVTPTKGEELAAEPPGAVWRYFLVTEASVGQPAEGEPGASSDETADRGGRPWLVGVAWSPALAALYDPRPSESREHAAPEAVSKTFDLLLDVSLPVSVSFGRTSLQIREVLKLNTGSIVELNRFVTDPVEVVVNDCVIARGEVVVVDGNYGVRINQLATREDRLRTGMAENPKTGVRG